MEAKSTPPESPGRVQVGSLLLSQESGVLNEESLMQGLFIAFWASFRNKERILRHLETCSNEKPLEPVVLKGREME